MTIATPAWDPTALLTNDDAIKEYLAIAFEDGDATDITIALGNIATAKGMTAVARDAGITREALESRSARKAIPSFRPCLA